MLTALSENEEYLKSIQVTVTIPDITELKLIISLTVGQNPLQVPIDIAVKEVLEQLNKLLQKRKEEASPLYSRFRLPNMFTTVVLFLLGCLITYLVQVLPGML
jgi:hypothetical protein